MELDAAQDVEVPEGKGLMIVDGLNLAFRYKHRQARDFGADMLRTIRSLAQSYNCIDVIILTDKGSSKYRKDLHPGYKAGRKEKYKDKSEDEILKDEEFFSDFADALQLLSKTFPVMDELPKVEADDIAAYLVKRCKDFYDRVWLISSDMDWDLLLDENVKRFSYVTRKEYGLDNFYEEHKCENPQEYISMKVMMGDSGDSVPGIHGVGPQKAFDLIRAYGSAFDVYDAIPIDSKAKHIQRINESGELFILNYELMDLVSFCEDAILAADEDNLNKLDKVIEGLIDND